MKFLIIPYILFLVSCCKEDEKLSMHTACILMKPNPAFVTEPFKDGYTIQFPSEYIGVGLQKISFISFAKEKPLSVSFFYNYFSDISSDVYFGNKLANPIPNQLQSPSQLLTDNLALRKVFCLNDEIEAILYYNLNANTSSYGKLYMKHNDWYYEGLNLTFKSELFEEVISIIRTIKKV